MRLALWPLRVSFFRLAEEEEELWVILMDLWLYHLTISWIWGSSASAWDLPLVIGMDPQSFSTVHCAFWTALLYFMPRLFKKQAPPVRDRCNDQAELPVSLLYKLQPCKRLKVLHLFLINPCRVQYSTVGKD
ncbi:hypothetical protein VNO77_21439 [Canavalia gladiata]|uniref:Uncharacterized protein n=1 Tax=Canavalia gladiata TaxID=3824 RepID=A0AAN9QRJ7_CANGL